MVSEDSFVQAVNKDDVVKQQSFKDSLVENVEKVVQHPQSRQQANADVGAWNIRVILQLIFAVLYYFLIVSKYPELGEAKPTLKARELQDLDEVSAVCETSLPNCLLSWCCTGPRAAQTFHSAGILGYWPSCFLMSCFPCCTLWVVNSFTDLNMKLGGEQRNWFKGAFCACCCSCCVVAQDAQALDYITGYSTEFCGVSQTVETEPTDVTRFNSMAL